MPILPQRDLSIGKSLGFYEEQLMGKTPEKLAAMFEPRLKALGLRPDATSVEVADAAKGSGGATNRLLASFLNQTPNTSPAQIGQLEMDKLAVSAADQLANLNQASPTASPNASLFNTGTLSPIQSQTSLLSPLNSLGSTTLGATVPSPMEGPSTGGAIGNAFPSVTGFGVGAAGRGMALEGKYGLSAGNSSPFPIRGDLSVVKMAQGGEARQMLARYAQRNMGEENEATASRRMLENLMSAQNSPVYMAEGGSVAYRAATGEGGIGLEKMNENIRNFFDNNPTRQEVIEAQQTWEIS